MLKKKKGGKIEYVPYLILIGIAVVGIVGATIVCFWLIIVAQDRSQKLLASSMLVPIGLGVFNMLKWLRSSDKFDELSNRLAGVSDKLDELVKVTEKGIVQTREIAEQRRKDEREPAKELLKSQLNKFITYWEEDKESILENDQKRKKELKEKLFEIGNELKTKVDENEKLLSQTIVDEARDIAKGIINLSNKIICNVMTKRIQKQEYEEGDELAERAKELIKKL